VLKSRWLTFCVTLYTLWVTLRSVRDDVRHRHRSSVNFRGHDISARKICMKNYQNTEFYMIFARKMPEFNIIIARKILFPIFFFWGGRGHASPAPISYAYDTRDVFSPPVHLYGAFLNLVSLLPQDDAPKILWCRSYRVGRQIKSTTKRHYWKQYNPRCTGAD